MQGLCAGACKRRLALSFTVCPLVFLQVAAGYWHCVAAAPGLTLPHNAMARPGGTHGIEVPLALRELKASLNTLPPASGHSLSGQGRRGIAHTNAPQLGSFGNVVPKAASSQGSSSPPPSAARRPHGLRARPPLVIGSHCM